MRDILEMSRVDIASAQLDTAIQLYLENTDLVSAATLAEAAEEILGKLVSRESKTNAFEETMDTLGEMHKAAFEEGAFRKVYVEL